MSDYVSLMEVTRSQPPRLAAAELSSRKLDAARDLNERLAEFAACVLSPKDDSKGIGTLLRLDSLGSEIPTLATHGLDASSKPFACPVRIVVRGQTAAEAVAQGSAMVDEVKASFAHGKQHVSQRASANCESHVMWQNLGAHSIRLDPSKSNRINWLDKSWTSVSELDPSCAWPAQRALLAEVLPHAQSWIEVLQLAREDGGMDIKDDCRLDDGSARCHQDGANSVRPGRSPALLRLALNVSSPASGRSLDYLQMSSNGLILDGDERAACLVHRISQDAIWHGAAQTIAGFVQGVSPVCHGSSAGKGPCLKRIITVFPLREGHPLAPLSAVQRLQRVGIEVHALDERHMIRAPGKPVPCVHADELPTREIS